MTATILCDNKLLFVTLLVCLVSGCSKEELYSDLPEQEANEIKAILIDHGIECEKVEGAEKTYTLSVPGDDFSQAIAILSELGRPKKTYSTIEQLFPQTGFVSSPAEQRIRLTYGLEQKLEETISGLPKIVGARVHLVLPDNDPFSETSQPSSASVVVTHRPQADTESLMPQIKQIVIGGVANLDVEAVSVELIEADDDLPGNGNWTNGSSMQPESKSYKDLAGIRVAESSVPKLLGAAAICAVTFLLGLVLILISFIRSFRRTAKAS